MALIETEGLITREVKYGDSGRILTALTKDLGKISILASRSRTNKSGVLMATQFLSLSRLELYKGRGKGMYKLNEAELMTTFSDVGSSLEKMSYASYFCDLANYLTLEEIPNTETLRLLLNSLYLLSSEKVEPERIKMAFQLRCMAIEGLAPNTEECSICGDKNIRYIDRDEGVGVCEKCAAGKGRLTEVNEGVRRIINFICTADIKDIFYIDLSPKTVKYISEFGEKYIEAQFQHEFKTLNFLKDVLKLNEPITGANNSDAPDDTKKTEG